MLNIKHRWRWMWIFATAALKIATRWFTFLYMFTAQIHYNLWNFAYTVLLMKSFHTRRSLFLITGWHHNPHNFRDLYSMVYQLPIEIFLLNSQKWRQMTQSSLPSPPLQPPMVGGLLSHFDKYKSLYSRNMSEHIFGSWAKIVLWGIGGP